MGYPKSLAGFRDWVKPGKKLTYKDELCTIASVKSQCFSVKNKEGDEFWITMCMGSHEFKGKKINLNMKYKIELP